MPGWLRDLRFYLKHRYNPVDLGRECKWAYQRVRRGWSDRDCFGADAYWGRVIPEMIEKLAEWRSGTPMHPTRTIDHGTWQEPDGYTVEEWFDGYCAFIAHAIRQHEKLVHDSDYWFIPQGDKDAIEADWQVAWALLGEHFSTFWD
jgi:hypothetical protein